MLDDPAPVPLAGGTSGETFLSHEGQVPVVVRIYAGRSAARGPLAAEIDAAVLQWMRGLVPVAEVLEVRRGDPDRDVPPLLITSFLPGILLEEVIEDLDDDRLARVGSSLGTLLGRLASIATPRPGLFLHPDLAIAPMPEQYVDLVQQATTSLPHWPDDERAALQAVAHRAQALLDQVRRSCLVHGDVNPKNVLVDLDSCQVTGLLDWEFAHSGSPYADLGNLLRYHRAAPFVEAVLQARAALVPDQETDVLDLARAADLAALIDLAAREHQHPVAAVAAARLRVIIGSGDLHVSNG